MNDPAESANAVIENAAPVAAVDDQEAMPSLPIELLSDVELQVEVVVGRARLPLRELLHVHPGSSIELDRSYNSPVEVVVNGTLFARGEIVIIDNADLGVRVDEIIGTGIAMGRSA